MEDKLKLIKKWEVTGLLDVVKTEPEYKEKIAEVLELIAERGIRLKESYHYDMINEQIESWIFPTPIRAINTFFSHNKNKDVRMRFIESLPNHIHMLFAMYRTYYPIYVEMSKLNPILDVEAEFVCLMSNYYLERIKRYLKSHIISNSDEYLQTILDKYKLDLNSLLRTQDFAKSQKIDSLKWENECGCFEYNVEQQQLFVTSKKSVESIDLKFTILPTGIIFTDEFK